MCDGQYSLLSDRPLRFLWTYTSRLKKHGRQFSDDDNDFPSKRCLKRKRDAVASSIAGIDRNIESCSVVADDMISPSEYDNTKESELTHPSFSNMYLPLVIDIGCGYGSTLLGLCFDQEQGPGLQSPYRFNFLGCDMSDHAISYCQGIAVRWGLLSNLSFICCDAHSCLEWVFSKYPGPVEWVLLQFPTPFALCAPGESTTGGGIIFCLLLQVITVNILEVGTKESGNSLLPTRMEDFMVTRYILGIIAALLLGKHCTFATRAGKLYTQSNTEDVAVYMNNLIRSIRHSDIYGHSPHDDTSENVDKLIFRIPTSATEACNSYLGTGGGKTEQSENWAPIVTFKDRGHEPRRQSRWIELGGERAGGAGWLSHSIFPEHGRTETEVVRAYEGKILYRALYFSEGGGTEKS